MWMELFLKRYFRWTVVVVVLVFVGAGYSIFLAKKISAIQTVAVSEKKQAETNLKTQQTLRDALKVSLKKYSDIFTAPNLEKINAVLPEKAEFPTILLTVQNVVASAGYSLDSISVSPVATTASTTVTPDPNQKTQGIINQINTIPNLNAYDLTVSVTGSGGYEDFKKMISAFEQSQQLFDVLNLNYSAVQGTTGTTSATPTYALTLRTYTYGKKAK